MVVGNNESRITKNAGKSLAISIAMWMRGTRGVHRPIEHIQGYTGSHWMPPLGECMCHIAAAIMVNKIVENSQNTNKTQLLASNYGTLRSLDVYENVNPKTDPLPSSLMPQAA
jgi:hypothetical protein